MAMWHAHSGIIVNSLQTALPFYRDVLGFRQVWETERVPDPAAPHTGHYLDGVHIKLIWLRRGDVQIELVDYTNKKDIVQRRGALDPHTGHVGFFVDDIQKHYERLKAKGVSFLTAPNFHSIGTATVFGKDPDGNWIHLSRAPKDDTRMAVSLDDTGFGFAAAGLFVDRMEDALPFYRDLLGMDVIKTIERKPGAGAGGPAGGRPLIEVWVKKGAFRIKMIEFLDKKEKTPGVGAMDVHSTHLAFFCDDLPAEHKRLSSHGIWFRDPPYTAPGKPATFVYGKDPDGNWFEINGPNTHDTGWMPKPA